MMACMTIIACHFHFMTVYVPHNVPSYNSSKPGALPSSVALYLTASFTCTPCLTNRPFPRLPTPAHFCKQVSSLLLLLHNRPANSVVMTPLPCLPRTSARLPID